MSAVDLYRLVIAGQVWTLTGADEDQEYNGELYVATPIGRSGVQVRSQLTKANLDVRLPLDHEISVLLMSSWLEQVTTLTVFRKRPSGVATLWKGRLTATPPEDTHLKLVFESIFTSMRRPGLRARFQKSCRHALYARGCNLDPEDFAVAATLNAITGLVLTVPEADAQIDGWYSGGMVKAPDGTLSYVQRHVGDQLTMNRVSRSLALALAEAGPGVAITIYPGCPHDYASCDEKFNNDLNYGGFDFIPKKNPMGGSSIV